MRNIARSRWTQVVSLAAVGVLALSACSSSDSSSEETAAEETAVEEPAVEEDTEPEETEEAEAMVETTAGWPPVDPKEAHARELAEKLRELADEIESL